MEAYSANATAEIIGYLYKYCKLVPEDFLYFVKSKCMSYIDALNDQVEMHELICLSRLVELLPEKERVQVIKKLRQLALMVIETNFEKWNGYALQPLQVINSSNHPLFDLVEDAVNKNLDYCIKNQNSDGSWDPNWSWTEDKENWEIAKRHWKGYLAVDMLKKLDAFGRIEK
jgi:hypothetical protein